MAPKSSDAGWWGHPLCRLLAPLVEPDVPGWDGCTWKRWMSQAAMDVLVSDGHPQLGWMSRVRKGVPGSDGCPQLGWMFWVWMDVLSWDGCPGSGWMSSAGMAVLSSDGCPQLGWMSQDGFQGLLLMLPLHFWHLQCDSPVVATVILAAGSEALWCPELAG